MVLDALIKIKNEIDSTLTFRRSCREGICGSCAMNIDGSNTLACLKPIEDVKGDVKIYPLPHMPVVKDLVPDLIADLRAAAHHRALAEVRHAAAAGSRAAAVQGGARQARRAVGVHPVLLLHHRLPQLLVERRPLSRPRRAAAGLSLDRRQPRRARPASGSTTLEDPFKLYRCHTIMNCTETCPKGLNPAQGDRRDQEADRGAARVGRPLPALPLPPQGAERSEAGGGASSAYPSARRRDACPAKGGASDPPPP